MAEEKATAQQTKATAAGKVSPTLHSASSDEENPSSLPPHHGKSFFHRRRRLIIVLGSLSAGAVLLVTVLLVLHFTIYKVRDPRMTVDSITVNRRNGTSTSTGSIFAELFGNSTVDIAASISNPNSLTYYYDRSTTSIYYYGSLLTQAPGPAGKAAPRRTYRLNVTVHVSNFKLDGGLLAKAMAAGVVDIDTSTVVDGHVKLLGFVRHRVDVLLNCTVGLAVANLTIVNQSCWQHVWS